VKKNQEYTVKRGIKRRLKGIKGKVTHTLTVAQFQKTAPTVLKVQLFVFLRFPNSI
jgi:hypothetical protein